MLITLKTLLSTYFYNFKNVIFLVFFMSKKRCSLLDYEEKYVYYMSNLCL